MEFLFGFGHEAAAPFAGAFVGRADGVAAGARDRPQADHADIVQAHIVPFLALDAYRVVGQFRA